jgi:hypothetical protein
MSRRALKLCQYRIPDLFMFKLDFHNRKKKSFMGSDIEDKSGVILSARAVGKVHDRQPDLFERAREM